MGVRGLTLSKDLAAWMRPLTFAVLGLLVVILVVLLTGNGGSPLLSIAIAGISSVLIPVDFNTCASTGPRTTQCSWQQASSSPL